jgi:molybdate transport system substrate-binding protein
MAFAAPFVVLPVRAADAEDCIVMTSGALAAAYLELAPSFERLTKNTLVTAATSMGTGEQAIRARVARGEAVDVVIVDADSLDDMVRNGLVVAASRVALARSGIGVAVRAGARKPDISSVDALKRALLEATSVAYSASVSGDYLVKEVFPRLGIADQMKAKGRRIVGERVGAVVARGEVEIGFQQLSELLPIQGIEVVGPLPSDVQRITTFSAGISVRAPHPDAAKALIDFLASRAASDVVARSGMEPLAAKPQSADEQMIREARARSNAAIAAHDPTAMARLWMDDVHVVRSTGSQVAGRERNQERMAQQFATRPDTIYVRQPSAIDVYSPWAMASERGEWTARWTEPDGIVDMAGTYMAQWRRVDGRWLIQAEVYVPTRCAGSRYCSQRP